jgi:hypothetical protein
VDIGLDQKAAPNHAGLQWICRSVDDGMLPDDYVILYYNPIRDDSIEEGMLGSAPDGDETMDHAMISYDDLPFSDGMGGNSGPLSDDDTVLYHRVMTNGHPSPKMAFFSIVAVFSMRTIKILFEFVNFFAKDSRKCLAGIL